MRYIWLIPFLFVACQHRPVNELVLADVAVKAAKKVKAQSLAPDTFRKAENHYLRAKRDYADGYYDSSRKLADKARLLAEQAEYESLLKRAQVNTPRSGGFSPPPPSGIGDF